MDERLQSVITGIPLAGPETVHIDVANACNLDCIGCWNHSSYLSRARDAEWKRQRIDFELFERVVSEVAGLGARKVVISGSGEPFTHPRIYDMLRLVKARRLDLTVITNLTLVDVERLASVGPDLLLVNLWAATPETYHCTHPNQPPETFETLREKLRLLRRFALGFNLVNVILSPNCHEVSAMVRLGAETGANRVNFKYASLSAGTERVRVREEQRQWLLSEVSCARAVSEELRVRTNLDVFESQLRNNATTVEIERIGCYVGYYYSRVYVDGSVFLCCAHIPAGTLLARGFAEVWRGEQYAKLRQLLREKRFLAPCSQCGKYDLNYAVYERLEALGHA